MCTINNNHPAVATLATFLQYLAQKNDIFQIWNRQVRHFKDRWSARNPYFLLRIAVVNVMNTITNKTYLTVIEKALAWIYHYSTDQS